MIPKKKSQLKIKAFMKFLVSKHKKCWARTTNYDNSQNNLVANFPWKCICFRAMSQIFQVALGKVIIPKGCCLTLYNIEASQCVNNKCFQMSSTIREQADMTWLILLKKSTSIVKSYIHYGKNEFQSLGQYCKRFGKRELFWRICKPR